MTMPTLPLGLACVAAATQNAGNEVALLNLMFEGDPMLGITNSIEDFCPNVIGISVRNIDDQNMPSPQFLLAPVREVIAKCRSLSDAPIILGGAGYSIFPESALRYLGADMGIQGEGEIVFPFVVDRISKGAQVSEIPGICLLGRPVEGRSFENNLDDLPLPEPNLWIPPVAANRNLWVPVQSRRGCPLGCTFCSTSAIEGEGVRARSPDRIVTWLAKLRETGCRNFNFVDNTFNLPSTYAKDLCRRVIQAKLDLNLWCIIYPKWIDAPKIEVEFCLDHAPAKVLGISGRKVEGVIDEVEVSASRLPSFRQPLRWSGNELEPLPLDRAGQQKVQPSGQPRRLCTGTQRLRLAATGGIQRLGSGRGRSSRLFSKLLPSTGRPRRQIPGISETFALTYPIHDEGKQSLRLEFPCPRPDNATRSRGRCCNQPRQG